MSEVFVFGSNLGGKHGAGSAKEAYDNWGAVWGVGVGRRGQSYAIPTKDEKLKPLNLVEIEGFVERFLDYARLNFRDHFKVVAIGCGLAGFKPKEIAPMFIHAPENVSLPREFEKILWPQGDEK